MIRPTQVLLFAALSSVLGAVPVTAAPDDKSAATPLAELSKLLPSDPAGFRAQTATEVQRLVPIVEQWAADASQYQPGASDDETLQTVRELIDNKQLVDRLLDRTLAMRTKFSRQPTGPQRQQALRSFLACTAALTDLSGRLRYLSVDVLSNAAYDLGDDRATYERLIDLYAEKSSEIGAMIAVESLFDPDDDAELATLSGRVKSKILQLIRDTDQLGVLPQLAEFIETDEISPELILLAAHTIRHLGLPQQPRPGRDATLPDPAITANRLYDISAAVDPEKLEPAWADLRTGLLQWVGQRRQQGVTTDRYRLGNMTIQAGDWLLMKNPSPYNRFTDLYPGLFTHVGVVAVETGSDGIRRFVVIDLPETGSSIQPVTVDTYVKRTLQYVFVRHHDSQTAARMGAVAQSVIGNESQFDLNFRTRGIERLQGQELADKKIVGYCAGILLLCCQETGRPRSDFFPIAEHPAGGNTLTNLAKLDVSMERDFLSPTGPLFSPHLSIAGRSQPMYSPRRHIEQAVYDHFAKQMRDSELRPSPDWYQSLRLKLAESSRGSPALARALADAAGVNRNMDLVAAAKLGAVVQTLDKFAYGASANYRSARDAFRIDAIQELREAEDGGDRINKVLNHRRKHADLYIRWEAELISPRQLRMELVDHYIADGKRRLDLRFFGSTAAEPAKAMP